MLTSDLNLSKNCKRIEILKCVLRTFIIIIIIIIKKYINVVDELRSTLCERAKIFTGLGRNKKGFTPLSSAFLHFLSLVPLFHSPPQI